MNVSLTPTLKALVQAKVSTGLYNNASEVIREALRLMEERDKMKELKVELLKKELFLGLDSLERGEFGNLSVSEIADKVLRSHQSK